MYILSFLCPFIIIISSTIFSSMTFAADPVFNSVNRHYYQLVEIYPGLNWSEAKAAAEALEYNRRPGYLATITTEQEQDFVVSNFPQLRPNHVWLGASDEANEGWFSWITGESDGYGIGRGGMYANWDSGEPNGGTNENCLDFADGSVRWNDANCDLSLNFYLVEYSAPILAFYYCYGGCGTGSEDPNIDVFGVKPRFEATWDESGFCEGSVDKALFGDITVSPFDTPQYITANRTTHPNFNEFTDALTDGQHCAQVDWDVVNAAGDAVFGGCACYGPVPDLKGAALGSIELLVGNGIELSYICDDTCTFSQIYDYSVTLYEALPMHTVEIDIKPGSYPNSINLKSKGKVPVAILTTNDFDAQYVDPETCVFAGAEPLRWNMYDLGHDSDDDIILHFNTQKLAALNKNSTEASLECETFGGETIIGTDTVNIVPKGKGHYKRGKKYAKKVKKVTMKHKKRK